MTIKLKGDSLGEIVSALKKEGEVRLSGVGIFRVKQYPARKARNPRTGETVEVPARRKIRFSVSKKFTEAVIVE